MPLARKETCGTSGPVNVALSPTDAHFKIDLKLPQFGNLTDAIDQRFGIGRTRHHEPHFQDVRPHGGHVQSHHSARQDGFDPLTDRLQCDAGQTYTRLRFRSWAGRFRLSTSHPPHVADLGLGLC